MHVSLWLIALYLTLTTAQVAAILTLAALYLRARHERDAAWRSIKRMLSTRREYDA